MRTKDFADTTAPISAYSLYLIYVWFINTHYCSACFINKPPRYYHDLTDFMSKRRFMSLWGLKCKAVLCGVCKKN